jgi:hypothetical protein
MVIAKKCLRYTLATKVPRRGARYTTPTKFDTIFTDSRLLKCIFVVTYRTKLCCNPKVPNLSHSSVLAMTHHSAPQYNITKRILKQRPINHRPAIFFFTYLDFDHGSSSPSNNKGFSLLFPFNAFHLTILN